MKQLLTLFCAIIITGCNDNTKTIVSKNLIQNNYVSIQRDTVSIAINDDFQSNYAVTTYNKTLNTFYGYNLEKHKIDCFFLGSKVSKISSIPLVIDGPNAIKSHQQINALFVSDNNDIFLINPYNIYKLNRKGEIISKNNINDSSSVNKDYYKKHALSPSHNTGFSYAYNNNHFYIKNTNLQYPRRGQQQNYFETFKLISKYNFEKNTVKELDIKFPSEFVSKNFGFNSIPFFSLHNKDIYYVFSPLPYIYNYNTDTQVTTVYTTTSDNLPYYNIKDYPDNNNSGYLNSSSFLFNSNFGPIYASNDFVFRFYQSAVPERKRKAATQKNKESVLQVFNRDMDLVKNYRLNANVSFSGLFINNNTVYININSKKGKDIRFLKLSVTKN